MALGNIDRRGSHPAQTCTGQFGGSAHPTMYEKPSLVGVAHLYLFGSLFSHLWFTVNATCLCTTLRMNMQAQQVQQHNRAPLSRVRAQTCLPTRACGLTGY